ncbi:MAG: hypothetical protein WBB74_00935 [Gaiellaceae bacterium]
MSARFLGLMILLLGVWGGIVPYVGPDFDYPRGASAWQWTSTAWQLNLTAGALAVVGGLILAGAIFRAGAALGALASIVAGAWFVLGPVFTPVWHGGTTLGTLANGSTWMKVWVPLGYHYGTGLLIATFGALALGLLTVAAVRPVVREKYEETPATAREAGGAPVEREKVPADDRVRA